MPPRCAAATQVARFLREFLESWERFDQAVEDVVVHGANGSGSRFT